MAKQIILVPDIGDYSDVPVIEVLIKVGDVIEKEQPLLVLESDKATMEIPADAAGTVLSISVKAGDKVAKGSVVAEIEVGAATTAPQASAPAVSAVPGCGCPEVVASAHRPEQVASVPPGPGAAGAG